ncbi:MAG: hypothetical protein AB7O26_16280 [Planctomycetaceae bacterium]
MNFRELERAVSETIRQGEIGIPVALRLNCQFGDRSVDVIEGAIMALHLAETAFAEDRPARLHARRTSDGRQLTVLASYRLGQTFFLTTTAIDGVRESLDLLLVGNHGIVRLEGGELFVPESADGSFSDPGGWKSAIERSLREQGAVEFAS